MKKRAAFVHLIAFLLVFHPSVSHSFSYDIDWPISDAQSHTLSITINGCETFFKVKNEDLDAFSKDTMILKQALEKAMIKANRGCK